MNMPEAIPTIVDSPFDRDPEQSFTIPARYYTDEEFLGPEKEAIFYRNWWYAGHQSQLSEPGCYLTVQVCDQNIIVIRDKDGELKAYYKWNTRIQYSAYHWESDHCSSCC